MFKTDSFLDNKKLSFNQNVWRDQRFTTKGWTERAIMLCKLNKSL